MVLNCFCKGRDTASEVCIWGHLPSPWLAERLAGECDPITIFASPRFWKHCPCCTVRDGAALGVLNQGQWGWGQVLQGCSVAKSSTWHWDLICWWENQSPCFYKQERKTSHLKKINLFWIFKFYLFIYLFIQQVLISYLFYTHQCIHVNPNLPIHPTTTTALPLPPLVSIRLFSTSVSQFLPCKPVHLYHFSRFHIYALVYNSCFSLSDLLHSVWQSLGPSTSLQMTQFHSFLWLSNIPLYICTTSLSIRLSMGI